MTAARARTLYYAANAQAQRYAVEQTDSIVYHVNLATLRRWAARALDQWQTIVQGGTK
jgi:hypothetical protein